METLDVICLWIGRFFLFWFLPGALVGLALPLLARMDKQRTYWAQSHPPYWRFNFFSEWKIAVLDRTWWRFTLICGLYGLRLWIDVASAFIEWMYFGCIQFCRSRAIRS